MNIDRSGIQGFMSENRLDGQQIGTVFVKMSLQCMTKRMTGDPSGPAKTFFMLVDMDFHCTAVDVFITKMADFANVQTGRIHDSNQGFLLNVGNGVDEFKSFLLGGNERKIFIKLSFRELIIVPGFM